MASQFIIRVRHNKGITRFELDKAASTTIRELKQMISNQLSSHPNISEQQLTVNGKSTDIPYTNDAKLSILNIKHGDILYLKLIKSAIIVQSINNKKKRKLKDI